VDNTDHQSNCVVNYVVEPRETLVLSKLASLRKRREISGDISADIWVSHAMAALVGGCMIVGRVALFTTH
jgi:hypothetical protein